MNIVIIVIFIIVVVVAAVVIIVVVVAAVVIIIVVVAAVVIIIVVVVVVVFVCCFVVLFFFVCLFCFFFCYYCFLPSYPRPGDYVTIDDQNTLAKALAFFKRKRSRTIRLFIFDQNANGLRSVRLCVHIPQRSCFLAVNTLFISFCGCSV